MPSTPPMGSCSIKSGAPKESRFLVKSCFASAPTTAPAQPESECSCTAFLTPARGSSTKKLTKMHNSDHELRTVDGPGTHAASRGCACPWRIPKIMRQSASGNVCHNLICALGRLDFNMDYTS